jgi:hypothetical protein
MSEWLREHAWKAWHAQLRRGPTELQIQLVAGPRKSLSPLSIDVFSTRVPRLHHVSTAGKGWALIQQANRAFKGCWTQVHVPMRRGQIPVAGELLNCPSWSPAHRQMRPATAGSRLETRVAKPGEPVNFRLFPQWLFAQFILFLRSIWILI